MKDLNPFENPVVAEEWIKSIESPQNRSREREFYPFLNAWTRELSPKVVVEIGSGQGVCSQSMELSGGGRYVGIEPSGTLRARAQELYAAPDKEFVQGSAYGIPLGDASADAAFSVGVWFHVEDLDAAHKEISRILKTKGELVIFTANPNTRETWESWFKDFKRDGKRTEGGVAVPGGFLSHNIFYFHSEQEITSSLEKYGFKVISIQKMGYGAGERQEGIWSVFRAVKEA